MAKVVGFPPGPSDDGPLRTGNCTFDAIFFEAFRVCPRNPTRYTYGGLPAMFYEPLGGVSETTKLNPPSFASGNAHGIRMQMADIPGSHSRRRTSPDDNRSCRFCRNRNRRTSPCGVCRRLPIVLRAEDFTVGGIRACGCGDNRCCSENGGCFHCRMAFRNFNLSVWADLAPTSSPGENKKSLRAPGRDF